MARTGRSRRTTWSGEWWRRTCPATSRPCAMCGGPWRRTVTRSVSRPRAMRPPGSRTWSARGTPRSRPSRRGAAGRPARRTTGTWRRPGAGAWPRPATDAATWFPPLARARAAAFAPIEAWGCRAPGASYDRHLEAARRRLVAEAVGARARGVALEYAEWLAGSAGRRWVARELYGPPWPTAQVDEATAEVLAELVARVR